MIIESCNNYIIHKVTQILIIMHYLSKISMQTGQCIYKKTKSLAIIQYNLYICSLIIDLCRASIRDLPIYNNGEF